MANTQRGEATIKGPGGEELTLCLTLGAMVQIEDKLGIESLTNIDEVFQNPSMGKVSIILVALLNGGGHSDITSDSLMSFPLDMTGLMTSIQAAFHNAGFGDDRDTDDKGGDDPVEK